MFLLFVLLFPLNVWAVEFAVCELRNGRFVDKFHYAIDIYAVSTDDSFELGNTTLNFEFNTAALTLSTPALSNQYADFNSNNYNPMTIGIHPSFSDRLQFSITVDGAAINGDVLPDTEILLATVHLDVDNNAYRTEFADLVAVVAQSTMLTFNGGGVFLAWSGSDLGSLICTPDMSGSPIPTVQEGDLYDFLPTANDVCAAGPLTFTITNPPAWLSSFDASDGRMMGTPTSADIGTDTNIVITASDSYGDSADLAAFDIEVASGTSDNGGGGGGGGCFISSLHFP